MWNDPGGLITDHEAKWKSVQRSGRRVKILGYCASACTLFMKYVPRDRVCVGPRAELGFHPVSEPDPDDVRDIRVDKKRRVYSKRGTEYVYKQYPKDVRKWIDDHGGLGTDVDHMLMLRGRDLRKFYDPC